MGKLIVILLLVPWLTLATCMDSVNVTELPTNSSDPNKDMYVIHAMVYQVGIVTNRTDNETTNVNTTGKQEAVTFYHTNGSQVDLSKIAEPLLTNVTAQSLVGVAPIPTQSQNDVHQLSWNTLNNLANISPTSVSTDSEPMKTSIRSARSIDIMDADIPLNNFYRNLFKRNVAVGNTPVSVQSGDAVIPQSAGVHSIAIPPLLTLNHNLSDIPVPIPNTSVVHYAKINTLVSQP